jgi:hypothetical protein
MRADAGAMWRFAVRNWPKILAAVGALNAFLKEHPGVSTWLREQLDDIGKRVVAVQARRGDAARIRGMLDIIRDVAREWDAHQGDRSTADAAPWLRRADDIELGVRLAEKQARPDQKRTLVRLRAETDALLADLLQAMARARSLPATDSPGNEPDAR